MAISETTLKDTMLMLIDQQNAKGGLLGKPIEAIVVDPASDWPLFDEKFWLTIALRPKYFAIDQSHFQIGLSYNELYWMDL